jgi:hypothetical protein
MREMGSVGAMVRQLDRMPPERRRMHLERAQKFLAGFG